MVLKESLRRQGLVEVNMEFGETKYLMLSLDEKEPRWPTWLRQRGSTTDLPWRLSWLKEQPRGCRWPRVDLLLLSPSPLQGQDSRQTAAEPTPNSAVAKGEKHFLSGGITLSCVFACSPMGQECCLEKCGGQISDGVPEEVLELWKIRGEPQKDFCCSIGATLNHSIMSGDFSPETEATKSQN